jgi:hypothetical protein
LAADFGSQVEAAGVVDAAGAAAVAAGACAPRAAGRARATRRSGERDIGCTEWPRSIS